MDKHPIGDLMETTMSKLRDMVDVNTIIGTPINTVDGITLIPYLRSASASLREAQTFKPKTKRIIKETPSAAAQVPVLKSTLLPSS
jgi:uncharacterized spore protein YtfJ